MLGFMAPRLCLAQQLVCRWFINAGVAPFILWVTFTLSFAWCELIHGLIDLFGSLNQQSLLRDMGFAGMLGWKPLSHGGHLKATSY